MLPEPTWIQQSLSTWVKHIDEDNQLIVRRAGSHVGASAYEALHVSAQGDTTIFGVYDTERGAKQAATLNYGTVRQPDLSASLRAKITRDFNRAGLGGSGRFIKPDQGYARAVEVLQRHGIEIDQAVTPWHLSRKSANIRLAWSNAADPFSPRSIEVTSLVITSAELRPGVFEVLAYLS